MSLNIKIVLIYFFKVDFISYVDISLTMTKKISFETD